MTDPLTYWWKRAKKAEAERDTLRKALPLYCDRCNWERKYHDGTAGVVCEEFQEAD